MMPAFFLVMHLAFNTTGGYINYSTVSIPEKTEEICMGNKRMFIKEHPNSTADCIPTGYKEENRT